MEFVCYNGWDQLPESAKALFAQGEKDSLFFSRPWFENLAITALGDDQVMLLACVVDEDRVLAILPLVKRPGGSCSSLRHNFTSLYTLLLAASEHQEILTCLARGLSQAPFHSVRLEPFADNDPSISGLQRVMEYSGFSCHRYFRFYNWFHRLQGQTFQDYMAARPARVRNTIARKRRKLKREQGYDIRLFSGGEAQRAMADFHIVYKASWKANELFSDIINGMVTSFSEPGWTRLAILYIRGRPAAAQLWFVAHRKASIFRLAYDEAWKRYSPGSILTSYLMEYVIDTDEVEEIDFLTGNEGYKRDWMSERRVRWGLVCAYRQESKAGADLFVDSLKGIMTRLRKGA